jgi:hypothetical protein
MSSIVTLYIRSILEAHLVKCLRYNEGKVKTPEERQCCASDKNHKMKENVGSAGMRLNSIIPILVNVGPKRPHRLW